MQKNGYPHYEIILPHRTRYRRNTGHGSGRGIGRRSGATAARYPAQYHAQSGFRHRTPPRTGHRPEQRPPSPPAPWPHADPLFDPDIQHALVRALQYRRTDFHFEFPIGPKFGHRVKHALPRTLAQHRRIHAPRTVQGTETGLETQVILPPRGYDFAPNTIQIVDFRKKTVRIPVRLPEQPAVQSERSALHAVYGARTEQHVPLLRLQVGNSLLESAKPTLQIFHIFINQAGRRILFAVSGETKIKK